MIILFIIESDNPFEAWIKTIKTVYENGQYESGIWELNNLIILIDNPMKKDKFIQKVYYEVVDKKYIERALNKMIGTRKLRGKDSYWMRLTNWDGKINQIENVIKRLSETPGSKHCSCMVINPQYDDTFNFSLVVMNPKKDWKKQGFMNLQPCLIAIDFKLRQNYLNLTAFFRSQLAFEISLIDYLCLGNYLHFVVTKMNHSERIKYNLKIGKVICHTNSSFVYSKSKNQIPRVLSRFKNNNKKI